MDTKTLEKLADVEHDSWSRWMRYMFGCGVTNSDGSWTMPQELVERWTRQMGTPYERLTETEKESDRKEVRKFLAVLGAAHQIKFRRNG